MDPAILEKIATASPMTAAAVVMLVIFVREMSKLRREYRSERKDDRDAIQQLANTCHASHAAAVRFATADSERMTKAVDRNTHMLGKVESTLARVDEKLESYPPRQPKQS